MDSDPLGISWGRSTIMTKSQSVNNDTNIILLHADSPNMPITSSTSWPLPTLASEKHVTHSSMNPTSLGMETGNVTSLGLFFFVLFHECTCSSILYTCVGVHQRSTNQKLIYVVLKHQPISLVPCGLIYDLFKCARQHQQTLISIDIHQTIDQPLSTHFQYTPIYWKTIIPPEILTNCFLLLTVKDMLISWFYSSE